MAVVAESHVVCIFIRILRGQQSKQCGTYLSHKQSDFKERSHKPSLKEKKESLFGDDGNVNFSDHVPSLMI